MSSATAPIVLGNGAMPAGSGYFEVAFLEKFLEKSLPNESLLWLMAQH